MKFSYNWLQSFFKEKLPEPKKLAELLTMKSFEVEEVKKEGGDWILDIDILPNRAHDCLSYVGLARECAALLKFEIRDSKSETNSKFKIQNKKILNVEIRDKNLCPRYTAYVIEGIEIRESPSWMRERLSTMEQKPINNVVDLTNYIMWELGQPLHAFDFDKVMGAKMTIRESKEGEELEVLDGEKYSLDNKAIIIEDSQRLIDLAGIKGGANTQIDNGTKRIILQAAIFDPAHIRKTTKKLDFRTDAAVRYMHGFDLELPPEALERAIVLLREINPEAKIIQKIDIYPNPVKPKKIDLDINYVNRLLGTYLSIREVKQILERLGFEVTRGKFQVLSFKFQVSVPTFRLDINMQEDLIEEMGRIYGYEDIKPEMPRGVMQVPRKNEHVFWRSTASRFLSGMGFSEVYNYSLASSNALEHVRGEFLELENPISDEFRYLRRMLFPGILKNVALNAKYTDSIKLFEFGKIFYQPEMPKGVGVNEKENCVLAIYDTEKTLENFYLLKGQVDEFFKKLGITDFYYDHSLTKDEEKKYNFLHAGRRLNIVLNGEKIGFLGEIHPAIRASYDTKGRIYIAEFDFEKVQESAEDEHIYLPASKYPEVARDIALLVPRDVMVVDVLNLINSVSGPLLRDVDLFDMYEGENIAEGMKNFAFHLIFQSQDRTLTAAGVDEIMKKITKILEEKGWDVRK